MLLYNEREMVKAKGENFAAIYEFLEASGENLHEVMCGFSRIDALCNTSDSL